IGFNKLSLLGVKVEHRVIIDKLFIIQFNHHKLSKVEVNMENTTIELNEWFEEETFEEAVEIMQEKAVVPVGTAMWPI
ncbi:hypothetical protein, partial [Xenorhabdus griffiniae]|uniref:hypothetical protein n=1 Tax=Xenorhabdus griffiniae TaxID=351672 RepID=UPI001CB9C077